MRSKNLYIKKESVTTVVLTYADRWKLLEKILLRLNSIEEIGTIIIIDNASVYDIEEKIYNLKLNKKIVIKVLESNFGSAGGYRSGIELALNIDEDFIMLLDDDTYIEKDALSKLNNDVKNERKLDFIKNSYAFFRPSWIKNNEYDIEYYYNTFFEFSILNKFKKNNLVKKNSNELFLSRPYVPYAGLIMSKSICRNIELPPKDYFLYVDDTAFSFGLFKKSYNLICYKGSQLLELESSWAQSKQLVFFKAYFYASENENRRANYNIRNRVNFEYNNLVTKKWMYLINQSTYLLYVFLFYMPKNKEGYHKFLEIIKYIKYGKNNQLGEF